MLWMDGWMDGWMPLALESFGGVHEVAVAEVRKLAAALARHTGQEEAEACRHLFSRLAILLQRGCRAAELLQCCTDRVCICLLLPVAGSCSALHNTAVRRPI
jgi:predicted acyl esterase